MMASSAIRHRLGALVLGACVILAACTPQPAAPTAAPKTETKPAAAATQPAAPAAQPAATKPAEAAKPAAGAPTTTAAKPADASKPAAARPSEYVIGHMTALTGPVSSQDYGIALRHATELAIEEINAAGGVGGVPLRGVYEDHQATAQAAVPAMQKLVQVDKAQVVLGSNTGVVLGIAPIAMDNKVLVLNCCARATTLARGGPYVYTSRPYDRAEEELFMTYLSTKKGFKKVAMIHNATEAGRSSRKILEEVLPGLGMQLVDVEEYPEGTSDFSSYIAKIRASGPDVLYMNTFGTDVGSILLQVKQFNLTVPIASFGSALDPAVLKVAGQSAEGILISSQVNWDPATIPAQAAFVKKYEPKYGATPAGFAALQYDTMRYIVPELIKYTQEHNLPYNGESLKTALDAIKSFKGELTGDCDFAEDRQCAKDMAIFSVQKGEFHVIDTALKAPKR